MRKLKKFSLLAVLLLFSSCAKHYESVAVGEFSQKSFSVKKEQIYLLFVSSESLLNAENSKSGGQFLRGENSQKTKEKIVHFVLTDALGVPKIKKDYFKGEFKSVAFLPPNSAFDELFVELLKRINAKIQGVKNGENADFQGTKLEFSFQGYEVKEL